MTTTLHIDQNRRTAAHAPFTPAERSAVTTMAAALIGFAVYGFAAGEPSTVGYLSVVALVGFGLAAIRRRALPDWLAVGLAILAVGHLCGGLIRIGDEVLYNSDPGWELLQYDHIFHASASAFGVAVLWTLASPSIRGRSLALALCALGALGFGALNELIEFLATLAHSGSAVGGYMNTGWDFVANTFGVVVGSILLAIKTPR